MNPRFSRLAQVAGLCTAVSVLTLAVAGAGTLVTGVASATSSSGGAPIVRIEGGLVRGVAVPGGGDAFLGLPYAAPPVGNLRWRPPQAPAGWRGVRDATQFAPSCPQAPSLFAPPPPFSEDCLYLNVYTRALRDSHRSNRPVLVWIHGGGFTEDGGRNYDGSKLAADGAVVVTINYRLGALGFLAHPALASRPGGPAGNYGLMDQQAALRWVRHNIGEFGGNPDDVTIAGQSAGGVSVLAQLVSRGSRGLFERAIVESGAFALTQQPLAQAEAFGETFAKKVGCANQTADCLRHVPVADLININNFPSAAIPGVIDGKVLTESIGTALAARAVRARADPQRHQPQRGVALHRRPGPGRERRDVRAGARAGHRRKQLRGRHRRRPRSLARARRGGRGRVPAQHLPGADRGLQHARVGRELRVPGAPGRPLDLGARADLRLSIQRRQRAVAIRRPQAAPDRHALLRVPVPV